MTESSTSMHKTFSPHNTQSPEQTRKDRILSIIHTHGWWVGVCIVIIGILVYINIHQPITMTNIRWDVPQKGTCHVTFTVKNTSSTPIQAQFGIFILKERKETGRDGETILFYDEIGHKSVHVSLPSRQSQVLEETVEIIPIFPVSKVTISIGKISK